MTDYIRIIIQIVLITALSVISLLLVRLSKTIKKEKRLSRFTTPALSEKETSLFDNLENIYVFFVKSLSKLNSKSKLFNKYSLKYEIYVDKNDKINDDAMNFISHKIIISFFTIFITLLSDILRVRAITWYQVFLAFIVGFFLPDIFLYFRNKRIRKTMENDLLKAVTIMNNAFKTGRSIMQAVQLVYLELDGVIADEFKKMYLDMTYGLDLEKVFDRFAKRINLDEINYMASALVILNKTGGDVVKVFDTIEKGFFERKKLKQELKSATALSELVFKVLIAMPILIFLVVYIFNNEYFKPLVTTSIGRIILVIIILLYFIYILVVNKVSKLKE